MPLFGVPVLSAGYRKLIDVLTSLGLTTNLKLCLDAGDEDSFTSGDKWLDVSGNGYDFHRGEDATTDGTEPAFNGTPGGLSDAEFFDVVSKPDYFRYDAANETWMENLHKDNADFAGFCWIRPGTNAPDGGNLVFATSATGAAGDLGIFIDLAPTTGVGRIIIKNAAGSALLVSTDSGLTNADWNFIGWRIDEATGAGGGFFYLNGDYWQVGGSDTFDATYSSPSAGAAGGRAQILASDALNFACANDAAIAMFSMFEGGGLTKANLDAIYAATNRDFRTPV